MSNIQFSLKLEISLYQMLMDAQQQRHEFITVEHLLLALLDNQSAAEVLKGCEVNINDLRKSLSSFIKDNTPMVGGIDKVDTHQTPGFQQVIQRAGEIVCLVSFGLGNVFGFHVLLEIFKEKDSEAVRLLNLQGVTLLKIRNYILANPKRRQSPQVPGDD